MDEYIELRFFAKGRRLRVKRRIPGTGGIEFDEPDPLERSFGIGFLWRNEATRVRMDNIRRIQGWEPGTFQLKMSVADGSIILRGVESHTLPEGFYKVRVQIEEVTNSGGWKSANVGHDSHAVVDLDLTMDTRDVEVDLSACDLDIARVLAQSVVDQRPAVEWLEDTERRPTRQACLLNLLATLRVRPRANAALIDLVDHVFWAANDRIYTRVDREMLDTLRQLANDPQQPFYEEGTPHAAIHNQLFVRMNEPSDVKARFTGLSSFRSEAKQGAPSMQAVVALAPPDLPYTYAEFDLDVGNPLQDIAGFFVHIGELLDGRSTNHLDLWSKLRATNAREFLYYRVTTTV